MAHNEIKIKQKLKSGICEVTIVNEHSVEDKISATPFSLIVKTRHFIVLKKKVVKKLNRF